MLNISLNNYLRRVRSDWRGVMAVKSFKVFLAITVVSVTVATLGITSYLPQVELRPGAPIADPVLLAFPAVNVTALTFIIMYMCSLLGLVVMLRYPVRFVIGCFAYAIMLSLRTLTMYLLPMEAPPGIIVLVDPFIGAVAGSDSLTKDLFFSGHTATMFIFALAAPKGLWKWFFVACTIAVGVLVVLQHVHYSIDVLAAFFFTYTSWRVSVNCHSRFSGINNNVL